MKQRLPNHKHHRSTLLAHRWTQKEALEIGILDEIVNDVGEGNEGKLLERAIEIGIREGIKIAPGSWGAMKVSYFLKYG